MKPLKKSMQFAVAAGLLLAQAGLGHALVQKCKIRFHSMDKNKDCAISRSEWRGNDRSFANHDWNGDGVLSGMELVPGKNRPSAEDWYRYYSFDQIDVNRDAIISRSEWKGTPESFNALDANRDGVITRIEFPATAAVSPAAPSTGDPFKDLDRNNDGRISLAEWNRSRDAFERLDDNRDGFLSVEEYHERSSLDRFSELDHDRDGYISVEEWHGNYRSFARLDRNQDRRLTRNEFFDNSRARALFSELDVNEDGRLSRGEWRSTMEEFDRLDRNGDNALSVSEFENKAGRTLVEAIFDQIFR